MDVRKVFDVKVAVKIFFWYGDCIRIFFFLDCRFQSHLTKVVRVNACTFA